MRPPPPPPLPSSANPPFPFSSQESLAHYGYPFSTCQSPSLRLPSQLTSGHRFLDLRFALKSNGALRVYHGIQDQFLSAEKALEWVYAFLEENPGECVVVSVKQENKMKGFEKAVWELADRRKEVWWEGEKWPSLGEARGKCIMLSRFGAKAKRESMRKGLRGAVLWRG